MGNLGLQNKIAASRPSLSAALDYSIVGSKTALPVSGTVSPAGATGNFGRLAFRTSRNLACPAVAIRREFATIAD
jgi:hypothetical protein